MNPEEPSSSEPSKTPPSRRRGRPPRDPSTPRHDPGVIGGRAAESFSHAILNSLEAHLAVLEHDGRIIAVNKAWERFSHAAAAEYPAAPGLGGNYLDALEDGNSFEQEARAEALDGLHQVLDRRRARFGLEYGMVIGGIRRHFFLTITPLLGVEGGAVIAHRETSELRSARQETADQARMLQAVLESAAEAVVVADTSGEFRTFNRAAREIAGVGIVEGGPESWSKNFGIFHPDRVTLFTLEELPLYRAMMGESTDGIRMFIKNPAIGGGRFIRISGRPWSTPEGDRLGGVVVFSDITAQVLAEEQSKLQIGVLDAIPLAILALDPDGTIIYWNTAAEQIVGWSAAELLGRRGRDVLLDEAQRGQVDAIRQHVLAGRPYRGEFQVRRPDGSAVSVLASARARRRSDGSLEGFILVGVDLTDEHLARNALHAREAELRQFQKMEAVGRLAAGVAHEFSNLLTVMQGYTDILQSRVAASDSLRGEIDPIARAIDRASDLTTQLSAFGRQQPLELALLNLNTVISDYMPILRRALGENIEVRVELDPDLGLARADAHQLGQLLLNVVLNSRDAMPGGGRLVITTSPAELDASFPGLGAPLTLGSYVQLSIADTGAGMSEDVRARVFEPFFTTKEPGRGSGLGLSTAHGVVRQLGGYIWLSSEPGRGTTFKMYLPRVFAGDSGLPATTPGVETPRQAPLTVLLIEDDASVRNIERRLLEAAGHRVLEAHDADSAIAQVHGRTEALDLVMCDIMLPGRNGHEVVAAIRTLRPGIRALFVSGHSRDVLSSTGAAPGLTFLQKPFSAGDLKDAVRRAMADVPPLPPR